MLLWGRIGRGEVFVAPTSFVLSETNAVRPDVISVSMDRMSIVDSDNIKGSPGLVGEIISPNSPERDPVRNRGIYLRHEVGEHWMADPEARSIQVMTLEGSTCARLVSLGWEMY